ncbi:hypothetical protein Scep_020287 [Stephania cephalantha]|uniref:THO complex subunit 5 n=1 Tax=Stephania cephalantha TaxID=152367 RepID=A0AAP0ICG3_9MAGN
MGETMEVEGGADAAVAPLQSPPRAPEPKTAYEELEESRTAMEEIVAKMLFMKKEGKPKSELRELITQMSLHLVNLRQVNRTILLEEDRIKGETERAKAPVDFTSLQLHNLLYEKNHYVKAIKSCKDFKSKHPDIELVPEEEFLRDAPQEIKEAVMSNEKSHDLMLKRLNFELFQRKELCKLHEELEQHKKSLTETIANRKKFLSSLPSHLKSLKKASLPVQQQLGVLHTKKLKQHQCAELLPPPLYVVYSQLLAQKEAFGENIDVEILGSIKDAQAFAHQYANKDLGTSNNTEIIKWEDDAPDEEDDGQRRRKRPKKPPPKDVDKVGVYQLHPLKVILHVFDDEPGDLKPVKLVTLRFEYIWKLNIVCVGVEGSREGSTSNILCNLFPNDTGTELPQQSAKLVTGTSVAFDERTSHPYKWAQHLGGIDFLPEVSPLLTVCETQNSAVVKKESVISGLSLYRQQNRVQTILKRIRAREKARRALAGQLDSLTNLKWPKLNFEDVPWALHTPSCGLLSWSQVASLPNRGSSLSMELVAEPLDRDMEDSSGRLKEDFEGTTEDGELPSVVQATLMNDEKLPDQKESDFDHSRHLDLISKNVATPMGKGKSQNFKKRDDELELIMDSESDLDEITQTEMEIENDKSNGGRENVGNSWEDYAATEFILVLSKRIAKTDITINLEAKIKISVEYPLRPPRFMLSLHSISLGGKYSESGICESYNELRAMEAEVNLHILKVLPLEYENCILAHQVHCLAMLFDFYFSDETPSKVTKTTSIVDVGLCKPVSGSIIARSFRGRDRRKMMSWKDMECTFGYPY